MAEIIDLTVSPLPEIIEISSDQENTPDRRNRAQEYKKRKRKKGTTSNSDDCIITGTVQPSRARSLDSDVRNEPASPAVQPISSSTIDGSGLFFFDGSAAPAVVERHSPTPEPTQSNGNDSKLLLPSHVAIFRDDEPIPAEVIPPPKASSDDEEYIEYLDYEDRKGPGFVRYFELEGEAASQSKPSIFKCKNCGAEGDHKTYECPVQICLTCGARDEHSTRSCPISKTCYTCGMKGHINKTCPNRFSAHAPSSDFHGDCNRCGSTKHKTNECPTLWRIYQYVNDEERTTIMQSREEKKQLIIGEGGEGYIGKVVWCYNCANTGHLGDDCDELPHQTTLPTENSAFSMDNVASGPFYDPAAEPISARRGPREQESKIDWPRLPDDWDPDIPVDVGKRGKDKDKELLEKKFREQEDEAGDWFDDIRNLKRRGTDRRAPPPEPRGKTFKFGSFKDTASSPTGSQPSLLARISGTREGRKGDRGHEQHETSHRNSIHIRGAATDQRNQDGRYANPRKPDSGRRQDHRERDKPGSRRGHGPRYRGGYDR